MAETHLHSSQLRQQTERGHTSVRTSDDSSWGEPDTCLQGDDVFAPVSGDLVDIDETPLRQGFSDPAQARESVVVMSRLRAARRFQQLAKQAALLTVEEPCHCLAPVCPFCQFLTLLKRLKSRFQSWKRK